MKLANAEISAERSFVTREFPVSFLCTKPLAVPRTSLQREPAATFVHWASKSPLQCTFLETCFGSLCCKVGRSECASLLPKCSVN